MVITVVSGMAVSSSACSGGAEAPLLRSIRLVCGVVVGAATLRLGMAVGAASVVRSMNIMAAGSAATAGAACGVVPTVRSARVGCQEGPGGASEAAARSGPAANAVIKPHANATRSDRDMKGRVFIDFGHSTERRDRRIAFF